MNDVGGLKKTHTQQQKKMKREDIEEDERPVRRRPASKREKKKMTIDELRTSYTNKIQPVYRKYDRNVFLQIWRTLMLDSNWTFKDALNFISGAAGREQRDIVIAVALNDFIAHDDLPWKHWFFMEFPDIVRDLKMTWDDPDIPYPWLRKSWNRVRNNVAFQHEDDPLFLDVIWRSCYMWTAMFRRQCAKYYAYFYIAREQNVQMVLELQSDIDWKFVRESVVVDEVDGYTEILVGKRKLGARKKPKEYDLDHEFAAREFVLFPEHRQDWADAFSVIPKAWVAWRNFIRFAVSKKGALEEYAKPWVNALGERRITQRSNVGKESGRDMEKLYAYNFTPQTVEAYIRWYCQQLMPSKNHAAELLNAQFLGPYKAKLFDAVYDTQTQMHIRTVYMEDGSALMGFLKYHSKTGEEMWPLLDHLPLCPRRIKKKDPEKRAIQFLGERDLGK
jgi:hypothetical protein